MSDSISGGLGAIGNRKVGVVRKAVTSAIGVVAVLFSIFANLTLAPAAWAAAASSVTGVTVAIAPTAAAGAKTGYTVSFKPATSITGPSDSVTVTYPAGTGLANLRAATLTDTTTNTVIGFANSSSTTTLSYILYSGLTANAGDSVTVTANGVVDPGAGMYQVQVKTSKDVTSVSSSSYSIVAGQSVTTPTVAVAPTTAAGARTGYTVTFRTSSTGDLAGDDSSTVTVAYPPGTNLSNLNSATLTDTTTNTVVGFANSTSTTTLSYTMYGGTIVSHGDAVTATAFGAVSPAAGTFHVTVSTSSDLPGVNSGSYTIVPGHAVSTPSVALAPTAAAGARSGYTITFTTSSTGDLAGDDSSSVTLTFPSGTDLRSLTSATLTDATTNTVVGFANSTQNSTISYIMYGGTIVHHGDTLSATVQGAVSPKVGSYKIIVSTTSDLPNVNSSAYPIVAGHSVSMPSVSLTSHAPGATGVNYTIEFKPSTTGGLSGAVGSQLTVTFPAGSNLSATTNNLLTDSTTAQTVGFANPTPNSSSYTLTFIIYSGSVVNAGDSLSATVNTAGNPSTTSSSDTVTVSDTSDVAPMVSCPYYIGSGPVAPCVTSISPRSGPSAGGTKVTITGTNFASATSVKFGTAAATNVVVNGTGTSISAIAPAGTGTKDVTVATPAGTSPTNSADKYKYIPPPNVTTTSLPAATHGVAYSATLTASGGKTPYSWSISAGSLPPGLTLNASAGTITGTPTTVGTYNFTVQVTDSENPPASAIRALSITVS